MIGPDLAAALPEMQAQAESLMTASCLVRRPTGVTSDDDGVDVPTFDPTPVYSGKCRLRAMQVQNLTVESGSSSALIERLHLHVPVGAGPFRRGDVVTVGDVSLRVTGRPLATWMTAQRVPVEELS